VSGGSVLFQGLSEERPIEDEDQTALGLVPVEGRGSLPFALVHGESLVAAASWALSTAGVMIIDATTSYAGVRDSSEMLVVHDPLCPLTPVQFIEQAVHICAGTGAVVVGVRPVTDTVKDLHGELVGRTHPREELMVVASPVVLPAAVLAELGGVETDDLAAWVAELATRYPVHFLEAPPLARRISSVEDLAVLEALSRASR
jgi:2-C-methyl-D-erythritol 4-phosphate cytidylyltransferase